MRRSKVLVIGGLGFIGSNLLQRHEDWDVLDIAAGEDVREGITRERYQVIILLAADLNHTKAAYKWNLEIYKSVVDYLMAQHRQSHLIFTSSAAVYQSRPLVRNVETDMPMPSTIYGKSKLLGEEIFKAVATSYTILRLANVAGTGDGNGLVDRVIRGGHRIYGDGTQVRDYVPVGRVVRAIEYIVEHPSDYSGGTYNISTGVGTTVKEVFDKYSKRKPVYVHAREFDVPYSVLDNGKAVRVGLL